MVLLVPPVDCSRYWTISPGSPIFLGYLRHHWGHAASQPSHYGTMGPATLPDNVESADFRSYGQLARFAHKWAGAPHLQATTVLQRFHCKWILEPPALHLPSFTQHQPDLLMPVQNWHWVRKGVVAPVPAQPCFLSCLFSVSHPDGCPPCLIIDMSRKNE